MGEEDSRAPLETQGEGVCVDEWAAEKGENQRGHSGSEGLGASRAWLTARRGCYIFSIMLIF